MGLNSGTLRGPMLNPFESGHHGGTRPATAGATLPHDAGTPPVTVALFRELQRISVAKLEEIVEPAAWDPPLSQSLQRGADPTFDHYLAALRTATEQPAALDTLVGDLLQWHTDWADGDTAGAGNPGMLQFADEEPLSGPVAEQRVLALNFILCRALIEVLEKRAHKVSEQLCNRVVLLCFDCFGLDERVVHASSVHMAGSVADLFAECVGVISENRFSFVTKTFKDKLSDNSIDPLHLSTIISSMKFLCLKLYPMKKLEASCDFLSDCTRFFDAARKVELRHTWAQLFVELLGPILPVVKSEVNVPGFRDFVTGLLKSSMELFKKSKHAQAMHPLVSSLLCVAQKDLFLAQWPGFLATSLSHLKHKIQGVQNLALDSIYRLVWVYLVRWGGESNKLVELRVRQVLDGLFPHGTRQVVPRDGSLNVFVRILLFISHERLNFVSSHIAHDLLAPEATAKATRVVEHPERIIIGLRAFLLIASHLEQDYAAPTLPAPNDVLPSGTDSRVKTPLLTTLMTDAKARDLGLTASIAVVRTSLPRILRTLDLQVGRIYLACGDEGAHQSLLLDRRALIDLFRTCLVAVPRCIAAGDLSSEMLWTLSRATLHADPDTRKTAGTAFQCVMANSPAVCGTVLREFVAFAQSEIPGRHLDLVDHCLRVVARLLMHWHRLLDLRDEEEAAESGHETPTEAPDADELAGQRHAAGPTEPNGGGQAAQKGGPASALPRTVRKGKAGGRETSESESEGEAVARNPTKRLPRGGHKLTRADAVDSSDVELESDASGGGAARRRDGSPTQALLHVEAFALVQLCSSGFVTRKLALLVLREVRALSLRLHRAGEASRPPPAHVMDVLEAESHFVIQEHLRQGRDAPAEQRFSKATLAPLLEQQQQTQQRRQTQEPAYLEGDVHKSVILSEMLADLSLQKVLDLKPAQPGEPDIWTSVLCTLVQGSLLARCPRLVHLAWNCSVDFLVVSPVIAHEQLLLRGGSVRKHVAKPSEEDTMFFRTLVSFGCASLSDSLRSPSPRPPRSESEQESTDTESGPGAGPRAIATVRHFLQFLVPFLRAVSPHVRKTVSMGLGYIKAGVYDVLSQLLSKFVMESLDLRSESARKKHQRDSLRLEVARVYRWTAFAAVKCYVRVRDNSTMHQQLHKYIVGTRSYLEMEVANRSSELDDLRVNFCHFVADLSHNLVTLDSGQDLMTEELRTDLFALFVKYCDVFLGEPSPSAAPGAEGLELGLSALNAIAALCCGPAFDAALSLRGPGYLLSFLASALRCPHRKARGLARTAVQALLTHNRAGGDAALLLEWALGMCYTNTEPDAQHEAFQALASFLGGSPDSGLGVVPGLCVALHAIGHTDATAREHGRLLVGTLTERFYGPQQRLVTSTTLPGYRPAPHKSELEAVASALAARHPQHTLGVFLECSGRFATAVPASRRVIVRALLPWLRAMDLVSDLGHNKLGCHPDFVFSKLFLMDVLTEPRAAEFADAWCAIASPPGNAGALVRFLVRESDVRGGLFLERAKRIVRDLVQGGAAPALDLLLQHLMSMGMKAKQEGGPPKAQAEDPSATSPLDEVAPPAERSPDDSPGSRVPLLLVDSVNPTVEHDWSKHLPTLLHASLVGMDHVAEEVAEGSKQLLLNVLSVAMRTGDRDAHQHAGYQDLVSFLMDPDMGQPWPLEDVSATETKIESEGRVADLTTRLLDLFDQGAGAGDPPGALRESWGSEAVRWATNCVHRHNAGRSLQILRAIRPRFTDLMLGDLLMRLADVVADPSLEAQGYAADVLLTLVVVVQTVVGRGAAGAKPTSLLPRLFATAVSLLESEFDTEFAMALRLISHTLESPPFLEDAFQQTLNRMLEALEWRHEFPGVHEMVLRGLSHPALTSVSMALLTQMTPLLKHPLIDRHDGLPLNCAALLPDLLLHYEAPDRHAACARQLAVAVQPANDLLSRLFTVYADNTYTKGPEDWLADVAKYFAKAFFPAHDIRVLSLLIQMLEHGDHAFHDPTARLLAALMKASLPSNSNLRLHGGELVHVILRLLRQHQWAASLSIMDATMALARPEKGSGLSAPPPATEEEEAGAASESDEEGGRSPRFQLQRQGWAVEPASERRAREQLGRVLRTYGRELAPEAHSIVFTSGGDHPRLSSPGGDLTVSEEEFVVSSDEEGGGAFTESDILDPSAKVKPPVATSASSPAIMSGAAKPGGLAAAASTGTLPVRIQDEPTAAIARARSSLRPLEGRRSIDSQDLVPGPSPRPSPLPRTGSLEVVAGRPRTHSDPGERERSDRAARLHHGPSLELPFDRDKALNRSSPIAGESAEGGSGKETHALTPSKELATTSYVYYSPDSVEEAWEAHVAGLIEDQAGSVAVQTFLCFTKLFVYLKARQLNISKECCDYAAPSIVDLATRIKETETALDSELRLPYVYIDTQTISHGHLLEKQRTIVVELQQLLEAYMSKRDDVLMLLMKQKASGRRRSKSQPFRETTSAEDARRISLMMCLAVCRMQFQLTMLAATYDKLLSLVEMAKQYPLVHNLSAEVTTAAQEILQVVSEESAPIKRIDCSNLSKQRALQYLEGNLMHKQTPQAVSLLHAFRDTWPGDVFGNGPADDLDVLVDVYARYVANRAGAVVVTATEGNLRTSISKLNRLTLAHMSSAQKQLRALQQDQFLVGDGAAVEHRPSSADRPPSASEAMGRDRRK